MANNDIYLAAKQFLQTLGMAFAASFDWIWLLAEGANDLRLGGLDTLVEKRGFFYTGNEICFKASSHH